MKTRESFGFASNAFSILLSILSVAILGGSLTGCGSGMRTGGAPPAAKTTQVVVLLTSTANDQLVGFNAPIASISLTNSAGTPVTIFAGASDPSANLEWMHLNGASEPLPAIAVPQGKYTAAVVTVVGCSFTNVTFVAGSITVSTFAQGLCSQGTGTTTVHLPGPIVVTGSAMVLSLDLQVSQSFTLTSASPAVYTISPTFNLTPVSIAAQPTDETNGKVIGVAAKVMSLNANAGSFTAQTPDGFLLTLNSNTTTAFQGVAAFTSLSANQLVNFDAAIQSDGSLLATRVEVDDPTVPAAGIGPFINPVSTPGAFQTVTLQIDGCTTIDPFCVGLYQSSSATVFNISQQFSNVASLPFPATFSFATLLQGQNLTVFTPGSTSQQGIPDTTAITLVPQTLNGTVSGISNDAGFTVYTVTLAPYDLIPVLQNYTSDTPPPHLTSPTTVVVYADSSVKQLNSGAIDVSSLLRFKGLVFFDNGTLRMDASEILDGVSE
ncbi:MAG TPA: hypothetical protein VN861_12290 [Candidatus Acidoferrales bacterium]|nr:hypothetical protein [Candidatus Acidoferrales bacterium]